MHKSILTYFPQFPPATVYFLGSCPEPGPRTENTPILALGRHRTNLFKYSTVITLTQLGLD